MHEHRTYLLYKWKTFSLEVASHMTVFKPIRMIITLSPESSKKRSAILRGKN